MLKNPYLRNILLISLALVFLVPLYEILYINPSYRQLLTDETEDEAVRFVRYLTRTLGFGDQPLSSVIVTDQLAEESGLLMGDPLLLKLRVFSPNGTIIYSTVADEIGELNDKPYFHQLVARGQIYSKIVKKDQRSAEGSIVQRDVVETYVPVMTPTGFGGAIEVYYDITESASAIAVLTRRSTVILVALSASLLFLVLLALARARVFLEGRQRAEAELKAANDLLEQRVRERTEQLLQTNRQLSDEVAEKTLAQMALKVALSDTQQAKEKIDSILSSVSDALLVVDERLNVVLMNFAARSLLCAGGVDPVGKAVSEVISAPQFRDPILRVLQAPEQNPVFDVVTRGGEPSRTRIFQGRCAPVRGIAGGKTGDVLLLHDVSQERELEQLKNDFLTMAAHELHTPITTIMGYAELLSGDHPEAFDPEQRREFHGYIHDKAESLARIVDDLLDISRMEAGQILAIQPATFVVWEELQPILQRYRREFEGCLIRLAIPDPSVQLRVDPNRFKQLLDNLVRNAVKYSPAGGEIVLSVEAEAGAVVLCVADQGIGMTDDQRRHAFDRFYRADNSTTAVSGTGLGLSVVRYIVEAHDGEVWIESEPGQGTRVFCRFPAVTPAAGD